MPAAGAALGAAGEPPRARRRPAARLRPRPGADLQPDRRRPRRALPELLPEIVYLALLPFAGHEEALRQARLAERHRRRALGVTSDEQRPAALAPAARPPRPAARAGRPLAARAAAGGGGPGQRRNGLRGDLGGRHPRRGRGRPRELLRALRDKQDCMLAAHQILVDDLDASVAGRLPSPGLGDRVGTRWRRCSTGSPPTRPRAECAGRAGRRRARSRGRLPGGLRPLHRAARPGPDPSSRARPARRHRPRGRRRPGPGLRRGRPWPDRGLPDAAGTDLRGARPLPRRRGGARRTAPPRSRQALAGAAGGA